MLIISLNNLFLYKKFGYDSREFKILIFLRCPCNFIKSKLLQGNFPIPFNLL
jgi:hypothetical protein